MSNYDELKKRIGSGAVIVLDGAVGTQLQTLGAPNSPYCWAAIANHTHPYTVRKMHEDYIKAGVDVITTNTYSSARHNYEPEGLADHVYELNLRAVVLAQEARDRVAEKPVFIAGAVSNFGAWTEEDRASWSASGQLRGRTTDFGMRMHGVMSEEQARRNLREQVEILGEAGVDFILAEATGGITQRRWVLETIAESGLPFWAGYKCHVKPGNDEVFSGYESDLLFADELDQLLPLGGDVVSILHSDIGDTTRAIPVLKSKFNGAIGAYPEAGRRDYVQDLANPREESAYTPLEWVDTARDWVAAGVQVIGGCCGMGVEYSLALDGTLPDLAGRK